MPWIFGIELRLRLALTIERHKIVRPRSFRIGALFLATSALADAIVMAQGVAPPTSVWDGVYTAEQAARGSELFAANCSGCHGAQLRAVDPNAPDLRGPTFRYNWIGKTLAERFEKIQTTMPLGQPRSLQPAQYVDILAFILQVNEAPPGPTPLPPDPAVLSLINVNSRP